jgi:energy-coupling factor transporter transmembrane protein EcfT
MKSALALLAAQLLVAFCITFENQLILFPLALLPVAFLAPRAFRMLLNWKLLVFLGVMVGLIPLLLGDKTATFLGIPYAPDYVRATVVMASRSLVILLSLRLFTQRLSLEELADALARTRFRQFGEAFTLAMELLPQLRGTAMQAYGEYRRAMPGRNIVRHTLSWTVELIARVLIHAETYQYEKGRS